MSKGKSLERASERLDVNNNDHCAVGKVSTVERGKPTKEERTLSKHQINK